MNRFESEEFSYEERLGQDKLVWRAKLTRTGQQVVVKFAITYNRDAHNLLASEDLAPKLLHADENPTYAGRSMIVMDFIEGTHPFNGLPKDASNDVERAMSLLHKEGFVFGNLQTSNIMITRDGRAKIIDFDWCAKANEGRYPFELDDGVSWADGVGPGAPMKKEHDEFMLKLLHS